MNDQDAQSILVIISAIFLTVLYVVGFFKKPRLRIFNNNAYFDKAKLSKFLIFLAAVIFASAIIAFSLSNEVTLTLEYIGLNIFISIIMGSTLLLLSEKPSKK